jgi:hypothetical protein
MGNGVLSTIRSSNASGAISKDLKDELDRQARASRALGAGKAAKSQTWEQSWLIEFPDNKDYRVVVNSALARTITGVTTRSSSGTCTLTVKINTTALGGTANSVTSTESTQAHTSANAVAVGDDIVFTVSANSSAENVSVTLTGTFSLA